VRTRFWRCLLPGLLVLIALSAPAQDDSDDLDLGVSTAEAPANLWLNFDRQGAVDVRLSLPEDLPVSDSLADLLGQVFHCRAGAVVHPANEWMASASKNWSAARRERYQKQVTQMQQRQLQANCNAIAARDGVLQADFDYSAVIAELRRMGVDELDLSIELPATQFREYTPTRLPREPMQAANAVRYQIPIAENAAPAVFHLAYGFRRADLYRSLLILAGFLVLPIVATLWMRRVALAAAQVDAAAAWFGFFRTLNWMVIIVMLLWMTSGFGARQGLQDWIAGFGLSSWGAAPLDVAVMAGPAFLIYFVCIALSYPVHARLKGTQWTQGEFLSRQAITIGARALPLMLGLSALEMMKDRLEMAVAMLILTIALLQVLQILKHRVVKELPQTLTTGELRDRVFALAGRIGVAVSQIMIVPARKGQVANAYAAKNKVVMFTDYLLEHLSKREVDGVAAHELAHLRYKHPLKRGIAFVLAVFSPYYFTGLSQVVVGLVAMPVSSLVPGIRGAKFIMAMWSGVNIFAQWSLRDFVLLMAGLTVFYLLSRRFENVADAAAVRLTGDPEAQITGYLRVSRLNFMPIHWGKVSGTWTTHPSTLRRVQRIAETGGMAPERLQEILRKYEAEGRTACPVEPTNRYDVPVATDTEVVRSAINRRALTQAKLWAVRVVYVLPLALFSVLIQRCHLAEAGALVAHIAGVAVTAMLVMVVGVWVGRWGYGRERLRLLARFEREHLPVGDAADVLVGFAPTANPRIFGQHYHWDGGFLVLAKDRLQFVGEKTKFSLKAADIDGIVLGRGGPSWWKFERIYVRWKDANSGRSGVFNLYPLEQGSVWKLRAGQREVFRRLQDWHENAKNYPEVRPELAGLGAPDIGEVTCLSPKKLGGIRLSVRTLGYLLPLAVGVSILLHAESGYLSLSVVALRLFQCVPYWRYRDEYPVFPPQVSSEIANARGANA
jgi:Zn-dependent protease with chaperone function